MERALPATLINRPLLIRPDHLHRDIIAEARSLSPPLPDIKCRPFFHAVPRDSSSRANNARIRVPGERFRAGEEPRERRLNKTAWRFLTSVHLESGFRRDRDFWKERIRLGNGGFRNFALRNRGSKGYMHNSDFQVGYRSNDTINASYLVAERVCV